MLVEKEIKTVHEIDALREILSDPTFTLPRLFPPIKKVSCEKGEFKCEGRFVGMHFEMIGSVYKGYDKIVYAFTLIAGGGKGNGRLEILLQERAIKLIFSYEGWMNTFSRLFFMGRWFENFAEKLDEEVRLERIRRKI